MKRFLMLLLLAAAPLATASAVEDPAAFRAYKYRVEMRRAKARQIRAEIYNSYPKPQFTPLSYAAPAWMVPGPRWNFGPSIIYVSRQPVVWFSW